MCAHSYSAVQFWNSLQGDIENLESVESFELNLKHLPSPWPEFMSSMLMALYKFVLRNELNNQWTIFGETGHQKIIVHQ